MESFPKFNFKKEENIIILDNEYGSNLIGIINKKINYKISKLKKNGRVCLDDLKNKIDKKQKLFLYVILLLNVEM